MTVRDEVGRSVELLELDIELVEMLAVQPLEAPSKDHSRQVLRVQDIAYRMFTIVPACRAGLELAVDRSL